MRPDKDWLDAIEQWETFKSDPDGEYDKEIVDIYSLEPMVTWGINPAQAIGIDECIPQLRTSRHTLNGKQAYDYTQLNPGQPIKNQKIDWAFVGSCTNGRIEDLREVARVLKNQKVAQQVTMYIVPGSEQVLQQAIAEELDEIFIAAGADFRMPGCSMCLAMNDDKVPTGARCISTSNRNFIGRQGPGSMTHLASPRTVAASSIAGFIATEEDI